MNPDSAYVAEQIKANLTVYGPGKRTVQRKVGATGWLMLVVAAACLAVVCIGKVSFLNQIRAHGARADAQVTAIYERQEYVGGRGGRTCNAYADFTFQPEGQAASVSSNVSLGGCSSMFHSNQLVDYVNNHHSFPIAYDVTNPQRWQMNFNDSVFAVTPWRAVSRVLAGLLLGIGLLGGIALSLGILIKALRMPSHPNADHKLP